MEVSSRAVHPLLIPALLVAAILGYLLGHHHSSSAPSSASNLIRLSTSAGALEYPSSWKQRSMPVGIPGLGLSQASTLTAREGSEGLTSGLLAGDEPAPLPVALLDLLDAKPHAEVVDLITTQAYRYVGLRPKGYGGILDVYVIPQATGPARVLVCWSLAPRDMPSGECERIVSGVTLIGSSAPTLGPEPAYARRLDAVISTLESARGRDRAGMSSSDSPGEVGRLAAELGGRFTAAAQAVTNLEAPAPAVGAQAELAGALRKAARAYGALAQAASVESLSGYEAARSTVGTAEAAVDAALESYSLLGYAASG